MTTYESRKVDRFNKRFPSGTPVIYASPSGIHLKTEIEHPAVVLSNGVPIIWLKNTRKHARLDRVIVS